MQADTLERPRTEKVAAKPARRRKRYNLREMIAGMSKDRHGEIKVGPARGGEFGA